MLTALRPFPLGERSLAPGDVITPEEQRDLPSGRVEQLKHLRLVEERTDAEALEQRVHELEQRVEQLEGSGAGRSGSTPTPGKGGGEVKRKPGRPKKEAA